VSDIQKRADEKLNRKYEAAGIVRLQLRVAEEDKAKFKELAKKSREKKL
jgi:hypothetical protein